MVIGECAQIKSNKNNIAGNEKFRQLIHDYAPTYLNVKTKYQKSEVIAKIVAEVRSKSSSRPGGGVGFVKKDFYSNRWFEVGDEKARDKVGTLLFYFLYYTYYMYTYMHDLSCIPYVFHRLPLILSVSYSFHMTYRLPFRYTIR